MNKFKAQQKRNELWGDINDFVKFKIRFLSSRVSLVILIQWCDI